jgi:hypothetical protein
MVFSAHLQRSAVVAIVNCSVRGQFNASRSLKSAALPSIWLFQESLYSEHRLKNTQQLIERSLRQSPQLLDETFPIYSSQLISHNVTVFTIKRATNSKRVWMTASCERRNDEST